MRLIDADKLIEHAGLRYAEMGARGGGKSILTLAKTWLLNEVESAPTIEAKPVVHGRNLRADTPSQFECSVCGCEDWDTYTCDVAVYKYCPKCGAQMDSSEVKE